jgi:potassium-dependent mechanosensitive channel
MNFLTELADHLKAFSMLWNHKLFKIQGVSLSLGNILLGLILLAFANRASKIFSRLFMKRMVEPYVADRTVLNTYRRLVYTFHLAVFVVLALTIAGIPLSIFTVVGGALAIGIGFGSQNIVNNFISGLILMAERPLKIGDVIEVDDISGSVIEIGTRATRIRTPESKIWIVPNSMFLEKPVLNWTNRSAIVRTEVSVGVAYGSDVDKVRTLALKIMQDMPFVEKSPFARVMFDDFGESALAFKLQFWVDNDKVDSLQQCRSDVRFAIEKAYREAAIEMSFPQRDLNLRSSVPLEIRMKS